MPSLTYDGNVGENVEMFFFSEFSQDSYVFDLTSKHIWNTAIVYSFSKFKMKFLYKGWMSNVVLQGEDITVIKWN